MTVTVYSPVTAAQLAGTGSSTAGGNVGPFVAQNTGSAGPGLGGFANFNYGPIGNGSILGATLTVASGTAGTGSLAIAKNGTNVVTAFSSFSFTSGGKYLTVTFASGTYTYVNGDYLGFVVTASSTAFSMTAFLNLSTF